MSTTGTGKLAEKFAAEFISKKGYEILQLNFRNRYCEIDIVALDKNQIVFIEVKYRRSNAYGEPEQAVTKEKLNRMSRAINFYLKENIKYQKLQSRLDVISIMGSLESANIKHIKNCFL